MTTHWPIPVVAYFLGSIPFGYAIVKFSRGQDVRSTGSGNIGATNVTRAAGVGAGAATLILDAGKGYFAVWLALRWSHHSIRWAMIAAVAVILGHMFPCWLKFRGGKGVATGFGVFVAICWEAVIACAIIWLLVVAIWRYISLASIIAAAALPFLVHALYAPGHAPPRSVTVGSAIIALLIIFKHRSNIARIASGTEHHFRRR